MFDIPKKDGKRIRTVSDFRKLNALLKRVLHHMDPIHGIIPALMPWGFATALDLNMGYYVINLCENILKFVRLVTIWGVYELWELPLQQIFSKEECRAALRM